MFLLFYFIFSFPCVQRKHDSIVQCIITKSYFCCWLNIPNTKTTTTDTTNLITIPNPLTITKPTNKFKTTTPGPKDSKLFPYNKNMKFQTKTKGQRIKLPKIQPSLNQNKKQIKFQRHISPFQDPKTVTTAQTTLTPHSHKHLLCDQTHAQLKALSKRSKTPTTPKP